MHTLYSIIAGPLAWIAIALFLGGLLYRLVSTIVQALRKERFIFSYMSVVYSLRSIGHWIIPFGTRNWRQHPILTVVTFCFHLCLLITPLFLSAHYVLVDDAIGLSWWVLPDGVADLLTIMVIAACLFFIIRRVARAEVRYLSRPADYVIMALVAAPFLTGLMAYHQWGDPYWTTLAHMLTGEVLLAIIPFTKLGHAMMAFLTRSYIGSEFGKVRRAKDW